LPIVYKAFFEEYKEDDHHHHGGHHEEIKEVPFIVVPLVLTAIGSIILGLFPDYFLALAREVIK
jgi:multicomponent Na+:H+ antiporter subunit D